MALKGSRSIFVGGWFGADGVSAPADVFNDGWWTLPAAMSGTLVTNHKIHYAIDLDIASDKTDAAIGLVSGVFRFVTDRPHYDGSTVVPTWGPDEEESGTNSYTWYQGFINKDGMSNPSRSIDISKAGDYGTVSSFSFKLRNNDKFWKSLRSNNISIINKDVRVFVVIDNVFYQIWGGRVDSTPRTSTEFIVNCSDESVSIHKDMPNKVINNVISPIILDNGKQLYKAIRVGESESIQLSDNFTSAPVWNSYPTVRSELEPSTLDFLKNVTLRVITKGKSFTANELAGKWMRISYFTKYYLDSDRDAEKDILVYIYGNGPTFVTSTSIIKENTTDIYVKQYPALNPPLGIEYPTPTIFNDYYGYNGTVVPSLVQNQILNTAIYIDIIDINADYSVGQSGITIDTSEIYKYDTDLDEYQLLPVNAVDNGDGTFSIDVNKSLDGSVLDFYQPFPFTLNLVKKEYVTTYATWAWIVPTTNKLSFKIPATIASGTIINGMFEGASGGRNFLYANISGQINSTAAGWSYGEAPIAESWLYEVDSIDVSNPYIGVISPDNYTLAQIKSALTDFNPYTGLDYSGNSNTVGITTYITLDKTLNVDDVLYIMPEISGNLTDSVDVAVEWSIVDNYGRQVLPDEDNVDYGKLVFYELASAPLSGFLFRGMPLNYYKRGVVDALAIDDDWVPVVNNYYDGCFKNIDGLGIPDVAYSSSTGYDAFKVPDYIKELHLNRGFNRLAVTFYLQGPTGITYSFNQVGVYVKRKQDLDKELYVKLLSSTQTSDATDTNSVYGSLKYILEDNDGIDPSGIVYGNVSTTRTADIPAESWITGRSITEQKNSKDYIKELTHHSFVAMYSDRRSRRAMNAFLEPQETGLFDDSFLVRDSIDVFDYTPLKDVYNDFTIEYGYDSGSNEYKHKLVVTNTDQDTFPASSGSWTDYVYGIESYSLAKSLWETAHSGYLLTGTKNSPPTAYTQLPWYVYSDTNNDKTSPVLYLKNLINWTSRQHYLVDQDIPITSGTINTELTDNIYIQSSVFTDDNKYKGYITNISYDIKNDKIKLSNIVDPDDGFLPYDPLVIVETGTADTVIVENGTQSLIYSEGKQF